MWTIKASPGGVATTLGGGTAISGGGTPDTSGGTPVRPVPAEFNHWFVYMFNIYKWKFLTRVSSVHNRFVALYNINRRVITSFNSNYGAAKSHEQMKHVVCEHFFFISLF